MSSYKGRSNVAYTIRFVDDHDTRNKHMFFTFLAEAKSDPLCTLAMGEVTVDAANQRINFKCNNTKWHADFLDVQSHLALWRKAQEWEAEVEDEGEGIAGIYAEVGIDAQTPFVYETIGVPDWEWLSVRKEIISDW